MAQSINNNNNIINEREEEDICRVTYKLIQFRSKCRQDQTRDK